MAEVKSKNIIDITKNLAYHFVQQVHQTPDALALVDGDQSWTYKQLSYKVEIRRRQLISHQVGRDKLVGVLLGRSADYVITCLAALLAGGAFLALELAYPSNLLADVLADAQPSVIVTHKEHVDKIKESFPVIILDQESDSDTTSPDAQLSVQYFPHDDLDRLAFVSYSSGTTGKPKGIANPHRAPVYSYNLRFQLSDLKAGDRVACNVFFIWEILRPLLRGACVLIVPDRASYDPALLVNLLSHQNATETLMTPTLLAAILSRGMDLETKLSQLRTLWLNGEVVSTDLARRAMQVLPHTRLLNCYSASETHEIACGDIKSMISDDLVICPVGPPMDLKHTYIVDEDSRLVDKGEVGELLVGGDLLAREYLNLPEVTARSFIPDNFSNENGARMYKTGDLARFLPSGLLEIAGRVGGMLKVRGYSVVPEKVQSVILEKLAVSSCVVTAYGDGLDRQVVAYVVFETKSMDDRSIPQIDEHQFSPSSRRVLKDSLAEYMIPTLWVRLDELPTHDVSAKIDLKRLPPPKIFDTPVSPALKPRISSLEDRDTSKVIQIWSEVLNIPTDIIRDEETYTFFDLGGHSLTLANLASKLSIAFQKNISVAMLVLNPTIKDQVGIIQNTSFKNSSVIRGELLAAIERDSILPLDIRPTEAKTLTFTNLSDAKTIFLTGATGYLGGVILTDLIEHTTATIICLVRVEQAEKSAPVAGISRIRDNLIELNLWKDSHASRVEVVPGNLSQKCLGLRQQDFNDLSSCLNVIIHAGATVNLIYPYSALRDTNVDGTCEVIRLAALSGATIHHVSTNGVLPSTDDGWTENIVLEMKEVISKVSDGYGQTKWVAEQLVLEAGRRGIPVRIYRPGTIGGHSILGSSNTDDLLTALLVESIVIGAYPEVENWRIESTPVDHVSKIILKLANIKPPPHSTPSDTEQQQIFHLGDPEPIPSPIIFNHLSSLGHPTIPLPWTDWVSLWRTNRNTAPLPSTPAARILAASMPDPQTLQHTAVLSNAATRKALGSPVWPVTDRALLAVYARHWYCRGYIARGPLEQRIGDSIGGSPGSPGTGDGVRMGTGPLAGRVVVVTGASAGIGAATAVAVAREGAHVVLAARRLAALDEVRRRIAGCEGAGTVLVMQTDVTNALEVDALVRETISNLGQVDVLVSCAGVMYYTMMANVRTDDWDKTVDVNCKGLLHCLAATIPDMIKRGKGHIVAISSDAGRKVFPGLGVYSASKFFVEATLQSLRLETAGTGLRVTSIQPGNTATELLSMSTDQEAIKKYGEPTGAKVLDPEDVARAIVYAIRQPDYVAVNEILIEPRDEPI